MNDSNDKDIAKIVQATDEVEILKSNQSEWLWTLLNMCFIIDGYKYLKKY